jgi:hypothetical protein
LKRNRKKFRERGFVMSATIVRSKSSDWNITAQDGDLTWCGLSILLIKKIDLNER